MTPGAERELLLALAIVAMFASLIVIPIGLPGLWLMIGILTVATIFGEVAWYVLLILVQIAIVAELAEYLLVKRTSARFGASNRVFWGALVGGVVGMIVGTPIPVVGSLVAGLLGTFLGAAVVAFWETRRLRSAGRAAWGAVLGRAFAAAFKTGAGVVILVVGAAALLVR